MAPKLAKLAKLADAGPASHSASLSFEAPYLIEKLVKDHICASGDEAQALFREVKRYLLLNRMDQSKVWEMYSLRIDEVWHQFVLFTRQYIDFCTRYYGGYLPHNPEQRARSRPRTIQADPSPWQPSASSKLITRTCSASLCRTAGTTRGASVCTVGCWTRKSEDCCSGLTGDTVELVNGSGEVVFAVNSLALEAMSFIADTGAFYVRELPGHVDNDEKIALVATLVEHKLLRLAS